MSGEHDALRPEAKQDHPADNELAEWRRIARQREYELHKLGHEVRRWRVRYEELRQAIHRLTRIAAKVEEAKTGLLLAEAAGEMAVAAAGLIPPPIREGKAERGDPLDDTLCLLVPIHQLGLRKDEALWARLNSESDGRLLLSWILDTSGMYLKEKDDG